MTVTVEYTWDLAALDACAALVNAWDRGKEPAYVSWEDIETAITLAREALELWRKADPWGQKPGPESDQAFLDQYEPE